MSKQQQAPGDLELVRTFVNTFDVERGEEQLSDPDAFGGWLSENGLSRGSLRPTITELRRAIAVREALRAILLSHGDGSPEPEDAWRTLDDEARRARLQVRFDARGEALLEPGAGGVDAGLGRLLAIVHGALGRPEQWRRLKACRLQTCEWAFYDHTKNRSGAWCNMAVCGNRAKARAYRERRASASE